MNPWASNWAFAQVRKWETPRGEETNLRPRVGRNRAQDLGIWSNVSLPNAVPHFRYWSKRLVGNSWGHLALWPWYTAEGGKRPPRGPNPFICSQKNCNSFRWACSRYIFKGPFFKTYQNDSFPTLFFMLQLVKFPIFYISPAWKRYFFWAEPPCMNHYRQ